MKTRRKVIPVADTRPGMRVAVDIRNAAGGVLVAAGAELNEQIIDGLRRRCIEIVTVDFPDPRTDDEIAAAQAVVRERVAHLFHRHGTQPEMHALMEAVLDYRLKELA
jgi:hypothetical protein